MKRIKNVIEPQDPQRAAERAARAKQAERNELLGIAQCFIAKDEKQDPAKVRAFAQELLAWLDESTNDLSRSARRSALDKVQAASWGVRQAVPPSKLIEQASVYYEFIAA